MTTPSLNDAAHRALAAMDDLISNTSDPGVEALGARHELSVALIAPDGTARRVLTPGEYTAAWHAVEGAAGEPGADPATVLHAVLERLGIQPPPTA